MSSTKLGIASTLPSLCRSHSWRPSYGTARVHPVRVSERQMCVQTRLLITVPRATADQSGQMEDEIVDRNVLPYCSIDKKQKKSLGELEQEFLQALQSYYYEGKAIMSNEEFDNLKEELMWEGSSVIMLSSDEQKFLEASMAYASGNPIMTNEEYDH